MLSSAKGACVGECRIRLHRENSEWDLVQYNISVSTMSFVLRLVDCVCDNKNSRREKERLGETFCL